MKKPDRRIQRTRQLLRDALISLILEKGYDSVTVQEITERANLGRATFYIHYNNKEELLLSNLHEVFDDLKTRYGAPSREQFLAPEQALRTIPFVHALENRDLYRVTLFSEQGTAAIMKGIRQYIADEIQTRMEAVASTGKTQLPPEVVANYLAGAMLALIGWWLEHDTPYSADVMADMYYQLTLPTLSMMLDNP
ncbi:MAG: TetR/AcrR family transcriptional regulator [Anaerolineae bacterium]|nr:TetR/AcrR family transcriptional regulator [Anaerolineae bacterium]